MLPFETMDGPRGYYTKWNKSGREKQMPYDCTDRQNPKKQNRQTKTGTHS